MGSVKKKGTGKGGKGGAHKKKPVKFIEFDIDSRKEYLHGFDAKVCAKVKAQKLKLKIKEAKKKKVQRSPELEEILHERKEKLKEVMNEIEAEENGTPLKEKSEIEEEGVSEVPVEEPVKKKKELKFKTAYATIDEMI